MSNKEDIEIKGIEHTGPVTIPDNEFHLGITIAGAVSAGCYVGGAMDYLFEALDLWEKAKNGKLEGVDQRLVPPHKVIIDAIGGASAGGATSVMSALHVLNGGRRPINDSRTSTTTLSENVFYDSWVIMDDLSPNEKPSTTFKKLWDVDDLKPAQGERVGRFTSLLNSTFIDSIATRALQNTKGDLQSSVRQLPSYISPQLEVLVSHTMLRGIPLEVPFYNRPYADRVKGRDTNQQGVPTHTTYEHFFVSHFKLDGEKQVDTDHHLWLNPYDTGSNVAMQQACMATAAFPVGIKFREFKAGSFKQDYIKNVVRRIVSGHFGQAVPLATQPISFTHLPKNYETITVDGGAMNNEPYAEVLSVLRDRYATPKDARFGQIGVVMVDAFPDKAEKALDPYKRPKDLFDVAPQIIGALWEQSKVKRNETVAQFTHDHYRGQIYPSRRIRDTEGRWQPKEPEPLACGAVFAFAGFLDASLRRHDFFLGRNNARNYIRAYLSLPYDKENGIVHPIHKDWTVEMVERFKIKLDGEIFLPILPDMNILLSGAENAQADMGMYDLPAKPTYSPKDLAGMIPAMEHRMEKLLILSAKRMGKEDREATGKDDKQATGKKDSDEIPTPTADAWMLRIYRDNPWLRFKGWVGKVFVGLVFGWSKGTVARKIVKLTVAAVLADLDRSGLLEKKDV